MAQLITATEVKTTAFLQGNIDTALIKDSYIEVVQEEHILPALGKDLYEAIVAGSLNAANTTLLETYIKPALAFFVAVDIVLHLSIRTANKGLMINSSETSNAASREERKDITQRYREQGTTMLDKMVRFIEHSDNNQNYPLYNNGSSTVVTTKLPGGIIL